MTMTEPTTHTLDVPGAVLTYDVRANDSSTAPVLLLIGSPMGATGFGTLAGHFPERTVVTYDPRGVERSQRTDGALESTPEMHAEDLSRLISALDAGRVDIFASSGGAVNALALVARHPDRVLTLVAHEPPVAQLLPDREPAALVGLGDGAGMAKFIALVSHKGPMSADDTALPDPDPATFGLPTEDDGSRDDALLAQNMVSSTHYAPDFDALRTASTRIVVATGTESEGELAHRAALALAERLATLPVMFPSNHGGFLGDEYGQPGDPDAFAARLREVLDSGA